MKHVLAKNDFRTAAAIRTQRSRTSTALTGPGCCSPHNKENKMKLNPHGKRLDQRMESKYRTTYAHYVLSVVRDGKGYLDLPFAEVVGLVMDRLERHIASHSKWHPEIPIEQSRAYIMMNLIQDYPEEAADYIRYYYDYVKNGNTHDDTPKSNDVTEKQIAYCRQLGYTGEIRDKKHASQIIGERRAK